MRFVSILNSGFSLKSSNEVAPMFRKALGISISQAFAVSVATAGGEPPSQTKLSAAAIVEKNVAARGGLQAWRAVQTMSMQGSLGAGGNRRAPVPVPIPDRKSRRQALPTRPADETQLPFIMKLERHGKMRMEIELVGMEKVEDRDTYKLKLTLKNGQAIHDWIDAQTFLEAKVEGQPRRLDGVYHPVEVYYRDYRPVSGLQIPYLLETKVLPVARTAQGFKDPPVPAEKIIIEKVVVNPKLDENHFSKPAIAVAPNTK